MSTASNSNPPSNWGLIAAIGAALGSSACCTIPLALVSLGVGGAWAGTLAALAPYRWIFVAGATAALGYAGYSEWRLSRRPDCHCETIFSSKTRRSVLGTAVLVVAALVASPWLLSSSPATAPREAQLANGEETSGTRAPTAATNSRSHRTVVLSVEGMTCAACAASVRTALEEVDGVGRADVTYVPPRATVRFHPAQASVENLIQATKRAGFPSHVKPTP